MTCCWPELVHWRSTETGVKLPTDRTGTATVAREGRKEDRRRNHTCRLKHNAVSRLEVLDNGKLAQLWDCRLLVFHGLKERNLSWEKKVSLLEVKCLHFRGVPREGSTIILKQTKLT